MDFVQKKEVKSTDDKQKLKEANNAFTDCISKEFLNKFLAGEQVKVEDFCVNERERMQRLDEKVYGKLNFWRGDQIE